MARLHYLCNVVGELASSDLNSLVVWDGNPSEGSFRWSNGSGDVLAISWDKKNLALLVFDHESPRSHFNKEHQPHSNGLLPDQDPTYHFTKVLSALEPNIKKSFELLNKSDWANATALIGVNDGKLFLPETEKEALNHGLWMVESYTLSHKKALLHPPKKIQPWTQVCSLSEEQSFVILELAEKLETMPEVEISKLQLEGLLTCLDVWNDEFGRPPVVSEEKYERFKMSLAKIGLLIS